MEGGGMIAVLYFIFFFLIYLPLSIWAIRKAYQFAKTRYQRGWAGGLVAAFIMYNLVFWDWIPVVLMHKHLCETEGGFWVYKTPEQWVKEHPEVVGQESRGEALNGNHEPDKSYYHEIDRMWFGTLVYFERFQEKKDFLGISRSQKEIVDANSGEILVKSVNFQRGGSFYGGGYKFWLDIGNTSCSESSYQGVDQMLVKLEKLVKGDKK
jgi:hypothetical protein